MTEHSTPGTEDDEPPPDGLYAPAPSPAEVAAAGTSSRGGWSAERLAAWGVPWPPPKGWRDELARRHGLGLDVEPLPWHGRKKRNRGAGAQRAAAPLPSAPSPVTIRDVGDPDPDDPPPWL